MGGDRGRGEAPLLLRRVSDMGGDRGKREAQPPQRKVSDMGGDRGRSEAPLLLSDMRGELR